MPKPTRHVDNKPTSQPEDAHYQYQKERYTAHIENRKNLDELAFKTSERYDQWVLTLSGGALAISLTFLEKIAPEPAHETLFLLGLSWFAYIASVMAGFCAIYHSRKAIERALEIGDECYHIFSTTSTEDKPQAEQCSALRLALYPKGIEIIQPGVDVTCHVAERRRKLARHAVSGLGAQKNSS